MELRQLRHFVLLSEELHYGRAARRLFIAQPPLSASIKRLEKRSRRAALRGGQQEGESNPARRALLAKVRDIVLQTEKTKSFAKAISTGYAGDIELGIAGILLHRGVAEILTSFRRSYPQVSLMLQEISSMQQCELVRAGQLDAGFVNTPVPPVGMAGLAIFHDRLAAWLPADHPLAREASIKLAQLRDEPLVIFTPEASPAYCDHLAALCAASGFRPHVEVDVPHTLSIVAQVSAGMGASVLVQSITRVAMESAVFVPLEDSPLRPSAFLIWLPESSTPGLDALVSTARQLSQ